MTNTTDTIDFTPSWQAVLPILIELIKSGNCEAHNTAIAELRRMARLADLYACNGKNHGIDN